MQSKDGSQDTVFPTSPKIALGASDDHWGFCQGHASESYSGKTED